MNNNTISRDLTLPRVNVCKTTRKQCKQTLTSFADKLLQNTPPQPTITRTGLGTTGFTFLCCNPSEAFATSENFVLKWQKRAFCINEVFCNTFISLFDFNAPTTILVNKPIISTNLYPFACKVVESMPKADNRNEQPLDLIFMEKVSGSNFKGFLETGKFLSLSTENRLQIFKILGSIVPFDLLIGNDDRLFRVHKDQDTTLKTVDQEPSTFLTPNPSMNYGNVMIDIKNRDRASEIVVNFIDSTTNPKMLTPELKIREESEANFSASLFAEEDDYMTPQPSPQPSSSPRARMQAEIEKKEYLEDIFMRLFSEVFSDPGIFSDHVQASICNGINEVFGSKPHLAREAALWQKTLEKESALYAEAILTGIKLGCDKMIQKSDGNFHQELQQTFESFKAKEIQGPDLLQKNLQWLLTYRAQLR